MKNNFFLQYIVQHILNIAHCAKQRACRVWSRSRTQTEWEEYTVTRRHAQLIYEDVQRAFTEQSKSLFMNAPNPGKGWSTVKTEVLGASSSLLPLVDKRGRLVLSADEKASLFSAHLDANHYKESFQQPHSSGPSPLLCSVALRSSFLRSLVLNLDPYSGKDSDEMFLLFCKQVTRVLSPKVVVVFRHLV